MTVEVMRIFADLHQKGMTILFATQYTGLIKYFSYRVVQISNGRILDGKKVDTSKIGEAKAGE
jgi:ABC-type ATPase involved in cell division